MKRLIGSCLLASLALTIHAQPAETGLKIAVHIYNYARASPEALVRAERETARIYESTGIAMEWLICPLSPEELAQNTTCDVLAPPPRLTLRLLSNEMAQRCPVGGDIFGFAFMPVNGGFGVVANVFADRARDFTTDQELHRVILGHLIAHELGHLLLGQAGHSAVAGIMHVPWQTKELEQIKRGVMSFLPEQAERIRAQVVARMMADQPHTSLNTSSSVATGPSSIREPASTLQSDFSDLRLRARRGGNARRRRKYCLGSLRPRQCSTVWQEGFAYAAGRHGVLNPVPEDPATLVVKLQQESEAAGYGVRRVCGGIGFDSGAIIFVRGFDSSHLGVIMAHEIGHMVLGPNAHSLIGIMRGTLLQEDWTKAAQGTLGFTRSQKQQIRTWIAERHAVLDRGHASPVYCYGAFRKLSS